jgi:predicted XRE-type DNA-binding protein
MQFETFDNLFDALADTLAESAGLETRFDMLSSLETCVRSWGVSHEAAAARLSIAPARLSDLLRGKLSAFSLEALNELTAAADPGRIDEAG